jgi:hypothetical protein
LKKDKIREEKFSDSLQGLMSLNAAELSPPLATLSESAGGENMNEDDGSVVLGAADHVEDSAAEDSETE